MSEADKKAAKHIAAQMLLKEWRFTTMGEEAEAHKKELTDLVLDVIESLHANPHLAPKAALASDMIDAVRYLLPELAKKHGVILSYFDIRRVDNFIIPRLDSQLTVSWTGRPGPEDVADEPTVIADGPAPMVMTESREDDGQRETYRVSFQKRETPQSNTPTISEPPTR